MALEIKASSDLITQYTEVGASDSESDVIPSDQIDPMALIANPEHHKHVLKIKNVYVTSGLQTRWHW